MDNVTRIHLRPEDDTVAVARAVGLIEPGVPQPRRPDWSAPEAACAMPVPTAAHTPRPSPLRRARTALLPLLAVGLFFVWLAFGPWLLGVRNGR